MAIKLVWTPLARADAKKIYIDIGREQPRSAELYFERFRKKAELLREQPRLGPRRPDVFASARMLVDTPYVILYETFPDDDKEDIQTVTIVRVIDGRRNLADLFR
jgi:toxin ParE1/3/4